MYHYAQRILAIALTLSLGVIAPPAHAADAATKNPDPAETINRASFAIHRVADKILLRPIAKVYHAVTPDPLERGIGNFLDNLAVPGIVINDVLQGKPRQAGSDLGRFIVNSTVGLGGLFDVASRTGWAKPNEDLGQTFAVWGIPSGPYLFIPLLGPTTLRDGIGQIGQLFLNPAFYLQDDTVRLSLTGTYVVDARTQLLNFDKNIDTAVDPYVFLRSAYQQRREHLIHDGSANDEDLNRYYELNDVESLEPIE